MDLVSWEEVGELSIDQKKRKVDHECVLNSLSISGAHNTTKQGLGWGSQEIWGRKPCASLKQDLAMHSKAEGGRGEGNAVQTRSMPPHEAPLELWYIIGSATARIEGMDGWMDGWIQSSLAGGDVKEVKQVKR